MTMQSAWRLVHTKPRQEREARKQLERQGYVVYLPMLQGSRHQRGKVINTATPLFPRYLFIHLTAGVDDWAPIRSTLGVSSLVRFGMEPARVPSRLITDIKAREGADGYHHKKEPEFQR